MARGIVNYMAFVGAGGGQVMRRQMGVAGKGKIC